MEWGVTAGRGGMRVGEIVDAAIKLYRAQAVKLWKIILLISVPIAVIDQLIFISSLPSGVFAHNGDLYVNVFVSSYSPSALVVIVPLVLQFLVAPTLTLGALSKCLLDAYTGRPTDWRRSVAFAFRRLGPLVWLSILVSIAVVIGFVLIILPGIWLIVGCSVSVPVLMFEGIGGVAAIRRSLGLVRGRWWATFAALLVGGVLIAVVEFVIGLVIGGVQAGLHVNSVALVIVLRALTFILATLISYPFYAAIATVIYIDLRVRKEALDLELLADGFTGRAQAPSSPATQAGSVPPPSG
ncbi:MAG: hypothetical protein M3065_20155 [Actinomycetota bacterium]|nr:hypothetical protein [Actinomycetota bacterium]